VWVIAVGAAVLLWLVAFSWWAPGPFFPVVAVVIILVIAFGRRGRRETPRPAPDSPTVSLAKDDAAAPSRAWTGEARRWIVESRAARRERLRRAFAVKVATLLLLGATLLTLGLIDAATGIPLALYFWFAAAILSVGLIVGLVLRRAPWSLAALLVPAVAGVVAFAGSHSSLHDGVGQRTWMPSHSLAAQYKLAIGQATLDLTALDPQSGPRVVRIEQGAGDVRIIAPKSMNLTVIASVHFGIVTLDGEPDQSGGVAVSRVVEPLPGATGAPITVNVHLADGRVAVDRR
jgi:FtsH-binding integral membrane protein